MLFRHFGEDINAKNMRACDFGKATFHWKDDGNSNGKKKQKTSEKEEMSSGDEGEESANEDVEIENPDDLSDGDGDVEMTDVREEKKEEEKKEEAKKEIEITISFKGSMGARKYMDNVRGIQLCIASSRHCLVPEVIFEWFVLYGRTLGLLLGDVWKPGKQPILREYFCQLIGKCTDMLKEPNWSKEYAFAKGMEKSVNFLHSIPFVDLNAVIRRPADSFFPSFETNNKVSISILIFFRKNQKIT